MTLRCFTPHALKYVRRFIFSNKYLHSYVSNECDKRSENPPHEPVMVDEVMEMLNLEPANVFLDMTFGAGGHSLALLERIPGLQVLALDRDPVAHKYINEVSDRYPNQVTPLLGKFSDLPKLLEEKGIAQKSVNAVLFDLGCSSMQLDNPERGFSFNKDGPLDMRMDCDRVPNSITAADVIAYATVNDLHKIFKIYGEERKSRKLANAIIEARYQFTSFKTTKQLSDLVECVCTEVRYDKLNRKVNTATKIFQALRIYVNNELNEINAGLTLVHRYLKTEGRAVVLTFNSLEDIIVKRHFRNQMNNNADISIPAKYFSGIKNFTEDEINDFHKKLWNTVNNKVILPKEEEVTRNPRSRSAKLRCAIKLTDNSK